MIWARVITLGGVLGILILLPLWYLWIAPSPVLPPALILVLWLPLLLPLPGLIRGRRYTYAWSLFLSLLYFAHGVGEAWTVPAERTYAATEIGLSLLWFVGAIVYIRTSRDPTAS